MSVPKRPCKISNLFQRILSGTSVFQALRASKNRLSSKTPGESRSSLYSVSLSSRIRAFIFKYLIKLCFRKFVLTLQNVFVLESERLLELFQVSSLKDLTGSLDSDFSSMVNIENGLSSYSFPRELFSWEYLGSPICPLDVLPQEPDGKSHYISSL